MNKVIDTVYIEGNKFTVYITIKPPATISHDYKISLEFGFKNLDEFSAAAKLCRLPQALSFKSELADKMNFDITHIVVTNISSVSNPLCMQWECLSDKPINLNAIE